MTHYNYSPTQLETMATDLLKQFNPELLYKPKKIDVYAVIEKCLGVDYDWKYLSPDQTYLGLTAFNDGYIWVWPDSKYEDGMEPKQLYLKKGTIVIDSTLTESNCRGRENFTVIHEVFHQIIHQDYFKNCPVDYAHCTTSYAISGKKKKLTTSLDVVEYQANTCAAAFLMPRELTIKTFKKYAGNYSSDDIIFIEDRIIEMMAPDFNVSKTAMRYRLENLNLI